MKKLTNLQIENIKNDLIKIKIKRVNRIKKADREYYKYEENKFYGLKGIRNLFNENDNYDIYEGIEYLFDEEIMYYLFKQNAFEYEEIKKLLSVKSKQEYVEHVITEVIIEQEDYDLDYDNYFRANYRRGERVQEIDYIKFKTFLVKESSDYTIDYEEIKCFELVNGEKAEFYEVIQDQEAEFCELIENQQVETTECEAII